MPRDKQNPLQLFVLSCRARLRQYRPSAEQPRTLRVPHYNRKALIAEVSLLGAAKSADAITTRELLDRGEVEVALAGTRASGSLHHLQEGRASMAVGAMNTWCDRAREKAMAVRIAKEQPSISAQPGWITKK